MPDVLSIYRLAKRCMECEEKILTLEKITGRNIDDLINLFLKGYTLKEPQEQSLNIFTEVINASPQ